MTAEQLKRIDQLFGDLLEAPAGERAAALQNLDDAQVRAEVASLLAHAAAPGETRPFDTAIQQVVRAASGAGAFDGRVIGPDTRLGPYRIERKLGQGGMGDVYEAVREDAFHKRVAIKIVRHGLDSEFSQRRFQQERQVLAGLEHPYIARLLDGGATDGGSPYLVLEYVDGSPIDAHCQGKPREEILQLFLKVCEGVEYAHRNLIIHRDLKPANIMVTVEGEPRLLDFGIAKLLDAGADLHLTQTGMQALTPQYASPEQMRGQMVSTATDVYSLGLILYELLAGRKAYTLSSASITEIDRIVCEAEPPRPGLSEDLDNILMMALRKDPARRYRSVREFADDIDRSLTHRPVSARPDTIRYRARKFVRRHWTSVAAGAALLLAIAAGVAATVHQARIARQRFEDVRKLAHVFVFDVHDEIVKLGGSTKAREIVVGTALEYLNNLSRNSGGDLSLERELAEAYVKVGMAQGYPGAANLGRTGEATASFQKAEALWRGVARRDPAQRENLANFYLRFADLCRLTGDNGGARARLQSALEILEPQTAGQDLSVEQRLKLVRSYSILSDIDADVMGDAQAALASLRKAEPLLLRAPQKDADKPDMIESGQLVYARLGTAQSSLGMLSGALADLAKQEALIQQVLAAAPGDPRVLRRQAVIQQNLSVIHYDDFKPNRDDPAKAAQHARRYLEDSRKQSEMDSANKAARFSIGIAWSRVAATERFSNPGAAVQAGRAAVETLEKLNREQPSFLIQSRLPRMRRALAEALLSQPGGAAEALRIGEEALAAQRGLVAKDAKDAESRAQLAFMLHTAGRAHEAVGNAPAARRLFEEMESLSARDIASLPPSLTLVNCWRKAALALAANAKRRADGAAAEAWSAKAAAAWDLYRGPKNEFVDRQRLARQP